MATTKPRITVTLPKRTHEVLTRLSAASGQSMSAIVAEFVELAVPSLERVVVVLERAKVAPQEARAGLVAAVERAERDVMPALIGAARQGDMWLDHAAEALQPGAGPGRGERSDTGRGRAPGGPKAAAVQASTPVPVTRGSGGYKSSRKAGKGVGRGRAL